MRRVYNIAFGLLLLAGTVSAQSQEKSSLFKKASVAYENMQYVSAIPLLKKVLKDEPRNVSAKEMLANIYRSTKKYDEALYWYEQLSSEPKLKPQNVLHYAEALANKEQYEKAEFWYKKYQEITFNRDLGENFVNSYKNLGNLRKDNPEWKVSYTNLNTAAAEYAPAFFKGGLLFSTNRPSKTLKKKVYSWDGTPFSNILRVADLSAVKNVSPDSILRAVKKDPVSYKKFFYIVNDDDTHQTSNDSKTIANYSFGTVKDTLGNILSAQLSVAPVMGKVNTEYHEAAPVLASDGTLYFTRNNYYKKHAGKSKTGINKLQIFFASGPDFSKITPFEHNNPEYSVGHPAVSPDGKLLIFTSDKTAGYGGTDLYYCTRTSDQSYWSKPINMGNVVNTEGNEMFPFIDSKGRLIFSSTGHPGLGGLDLFSIQLRDNEPVGNPVNFGAPLNSSLDDFAAIFSEDGKSGFFSSNRRGNDDIYSFVHKTYEVVLKGKVLDARTGQALANAPVTLNASSGNQSVKTDANGFFTATLNKQTDFKVVIKSAGYTDLQSAVSSNGIMKDSTLKATYQLSLLPPKKQEVIVNCDSIRKAFEVHNIYYDLNKADIRPDAVPGLDHVVKLMAANPVISIIAASHCDSRANEEYNIKLSLRRSNAVRDYLVSHGVDPRRIKAQYYGKSHLAVTGDETAEEIQKLNRRTEFFVVANGVNVTLKGCLK